MPSLAGAAVVVIAWDTHVYGPPVAVGAAIFVFAFCMVAVVRHWHEPTISPDR